jgi:hypothetical protein
MNALKRLLLPLALLVLQGCSTLVALPAPPASDTLTSGAPDATAAQAAWARVLQTFVNEQGLVDFAALARSPADLHTYVRFVARTPATDIADPQERLAHHINAYNALSMFNVIDLGIPETNQPLTARYRFFIARKHVIGGQRLSLYAYENEVIRPLDEPRVHWALNCSALACPVLPRLPFTGPELERQLQTESIRFFANPRNFRVDDARRTVYLSEILSFFTEDFVPNHAPNLIAYANRYAPRQADTSYQVKFVPYDWTIANWER